MKHTRLFSIFTALLAAASLLVIGAACSKQAGGGKPADVDYYTCTMHPSVRSQKPGDKCPICSMDLVPVKKKDAAGATAAATSAGGAPAHQHGAAMTEHPGGVAPQPASPQTGNEFVVPVERQQQIGVTYATVERKPLHHSVRSVGMIVPDKSRHWEFVARVEGYVQKLYVTSPGEIVERDAPLMSIYSPDLLTSERELVQLLQMRDKTRGSDVADRLIEAAKIRLKQWNVTDAQIAELEKSRKPSEFLTLLSPFRGIVEAVPVDQGRKIMVGDHLVDLADLSVVWVWAEFYENELPMLEKGQKVAVSARSYPGQTFDGTIALVNPFINETKRTAQVRIDIDNPDFKLRPGMYVNAELGMDMGTALTVPVSAVMPTGVRNVVFVDKGAGKLEPRLVELGSKYGELYEVQSGVTEGERVVASANFLIDAESKVQGALKAFEEEGSQPQSGAMEKAAKPAETAAKSVPLPADARAVYEPLMRTYFAIHDQLARDNFENITESAAQLRQQTAAVSSSDIKPAAEAGAYRDRLTALQQAVEKFKPASLDEARVQFGQVSSPLIALLAQFPPPLDETLYVVKCPMWEKSPAQWIQAKAQIENPFMGQAMAGCGELVNSQEAAK